VPPNAFHQLTNVGDTPLRFVYCYAPAGEVAHWRQELEGTLPPAGTDGIPEMPAGAWPQHTAATPSEARRPEGWTAPEPG
jgi:oxalate decarboxylase/phosphoglucose isomerase-like protein (cupin superfamily)